MNYFLFILFMLLDISFTVHRQIYRTPSKFPYQLLGCPKGNFGSLKRQQHNSCDVYHYTINCLTVRLLQTLQQDLVPVPDQAYMRNWNWEPSHSECNVISYSKGYLGGKSSQFAAINVSHKKNCYIQDWLQYLHVCIPCSKRPNSDYFACVLGINIINNCNK